MEITKTVDNRIVLSQSLFGAHGTIIPHYGTIQDANTYFDNRLKSEAWTAATLDDKRKALVMATRAIDRLNFEGAVSVEGQSLQFPRGGDTIVPPDIEIATYEEALALLDDYDPQQTMSALAVEASSISSVRTVYNRRNMQSSRIHGLTSHIAWTYILPFLRDASELTLTRSS